MMIPPSKCNLKIYKGATFSFVTWVMFLDKTKMNFTGYAGRMQIRPRADSERLIASLTTENGGISVEGVEIKLIMSAAQTSAIEDADGVYDLEMVAPDGTVQRILEGKVSISAEITR